MKHEYSVVIPVYNSQETIEACLLSVLYQKLTPIEVILIDDCSTDNTAVIINRLKLLFDNSGINLKNHILKKNSGPAIARNIGIRVASGNYIAFLDSDDIWHNDKIKIIDLFVNKFNPGIIYHTYTLDDFSYRDLYENEYKLNPRNINNLLIRNPAQTSCVVMQRNIDTMFNEKMRYCEDYDLWIRVAEKANFYELVGPPMTKLGRPQLTSGGLSGNLLMMRYGEMNVYIRYCVRHLLTRIWLLPILLLYSIIKHFYLLIRKI